MMMCFVGITYADECTYAHTHIGINPTWRPDWTAPGDAALAVDPDPTDDNKLWFFSLPPVHASATPGWPNWQQSDGGPFLLLSQYLDSGSVVYKGDGSGKILWTSDFLYSKAGGYGDASGTTHINGWHSAHGPQGVWNLESVDEATTPSWDIQLVRVGTSLDLESDFFTMLPDYSTALTRDGDEYDLPVDYLTDKSAWGFHQHMAFMFWLDPAFDGTVSATFYAYDTGGLYDRSAEYTIEFATSVCVPLEGDFDGDCKVELDDFAVFASNWLLSGTVE